MEQSNAELVCTLFCVKSSTASRLWKSFSLRFQECFVFKLKTAFPYSSNSASIDISEITESANFLFLILFVYINIIYIKNMYII